MKVQSLDNMPLELRGTAIQSGAAKKLHEDRKIFLDTMNRFTPVGVNDLVKIRPEMAGGFKMFDNNNNDDFNMQEGLMSDLDYKLMNPMSKEDIMRNLGIQNPGDEYEIDWQRAGLNGTAKDRIELADKLYPTLQKEQEKLHFKRELLNQRLEEARSKLLEAEQPKIEFESQTGPLHYRTSDLGQQQAVAPEAAEIMQSQTQFLPGSNIAVNPMLRSDLARNYGVYPGSDPYQDEIDILEEKDDIFQEINHWYSSKERPTEQNLDVVKQLNHRRLAQVQSLYMKKKKELEDLQRFKQMSEMVQEEEDYQPRRGKKKPRKERNKEKRNYKDKFKQYLHNRDKMKRKGGAEEGIDFDRYECTSPNPKRVDKEYEVKFLEMQRADQTGQVGKSKVEKSKSKGKRAKQKSRVEEEEEDEEDVEIVVDWIWHKMNPHYKTHVTKKEMIDFLMEDDEIKEVFDLSENQLAHVVEAYVTDRPDEFNYDEFTQFLIDNKVGGEEARSRREKKKQEKERKECLLTEEQLIILKENFEKLDKYGDLVVPRAKLIETIQDDPRMKKYLDRGVVYIPTVGKEIAMRKVLHQIEQEEFLKADKIDIGEADFMSTKRYISWAQFLEYFTNYSKNDKISNVDLEFKRDEIDDQNVIEVPKGLLENIRKTFDSLKGKDGYVKTIELLDKMMAEPEIRIFFESAARAEARYGSLPAENLQEVLERVEKDGEDWMDWDEFIQYFTKRGVPLRVVKQKEMPRLTRVLAERKKDTDAGDAFNHYRSAKKAAKVMGDKLHPQREEEQIEKTQLMGRNRNEVGRIDLLGDTNKDFMDTKNLSDNSPSKIIFDSKSMLKTQNLKEKEEEPRIEEYTDEERRLLGLEPLDRSRPQEDEQEEDEEDYYSGEEERSYHSEDEFSEDSVVRYGDEVKKITVPELTGYQERQENREKSETLQTKKFKDWMDKKREEEEAELNFQFKAKEVPKKVREPLYDQLIYEQELRREEVKKNSVAMTRANEKPFSFYERDKNKEKKYKSDYDFKPKKFKANEVPWFCSVELYEQEMEKAEQLRKERINRRAQAMLAKAKLPPRMEKHEQERKQQRLLGQDRRALDWDDEMTFQPQIGREVPDFKKAQAKFQSMLDKKRSFKKPTKIKEFKFHSTNRVPTIDYLEQENEDRMREYNAQKHAMQKKNRKNLHRYRQEKALGLKYQPAATDKYRAQVELTKKERLKRKKREERKQHDLALRKKKEKEAAQRLRAALAAEEAAAGRDKPPPKPKKLDNREHIQAQKRRIKRAKESRPYSFQNYNEKNEKMMRLKKMTTLLNMHDKMKKNRIKDWQKNFTREEINMIEDAKILRKNGKLDVF